MQRLPPPWVLVLFGLILNVMAILMSSVVLDKLGYQHNVFAEEKDENLYAIQLAWNSVETLERKREMLLLHLRQEDDRSAVISQALQDQLSEWVNKSVPQISQANLRELMGLINQAQQTHRERIDNFYLENLTLSEQMNELDAEIAWYKNIGLFLQIFGLALILARDLARK
tara:strand:+ start:2476 stop:2988 length:513 start_codon:yes stop_codon:yes gene_type:complete